MIQILLKCPHCPGVFTVEIVKGDYDGSGFYTLPYDVVCPTCKGFYGRMKAGRQVAVVSTSEETA